MGVKVKLLLFGLLFSMLSFGQMQDLKSLAVGELVYSSILYDANGDLYGYFYLYQRDADKVSKTMEYVFLDKNLNKVSNNTFVNNSYKKSRYSMGIKSHYIDCNLMGDYVILTNSYYYYKSVYVGNTNYPIALTTAFQIISLKDKSVSNEMKYQDGVFSELPVEASLLKKENRKVDTESVVRAYDNGSFRGFFISQVNKNGLDYKEKDIRFYNEKRELLWSYEYNPNGTRRDFTGCRVIHVNKDNMYLLESRYKNKYASENKIVLVDLKTGNKKYETTFEDLKSKYNHTVKAKEINGQLVIAGNYCRYKKGWNFRLDKNLGYYKLVLDENGKEISRRYTQWSDFATAIKVNKKGRVKSNYRLDTKRIFFFKDGAISVLAEKFKPVKHGIGIPIPILNVFIYAATSSPEMTTDFVLMNMDKDFQLKNVNKIKKDLTKKQNNDYLFSQYIRDEAGGVFFFQDYTRNPETNKKQWMLGINTIMDGKLTEEKIPMASKNKYSIQPFPAKEGYVMLREYNEKEKYNQIRLEKLNF